MFPDIGKAKAAIICGILALFVLTGCGTRYHIEKKLDGTIVADTRSSRSYQYFDLAYNPTTGMFRVIAVGVTDDTAKIVEVAVGSLENIVVSSLQMPGQNSSHEEWDAYFQKHNAAVNEAIKTN
jgi:hypothetical protein